MRRLSIVLLVVTVTFCCQIRESSGFSANNWKKWTEKAVQGLNNAAKKARTALRAMKDVVLGERCKKRWIVGNLTGLEHSLKASLCGQELAVQIITKVLQQSYGRGEESRQPPLSFHFNGGTGTGKSFTAQLIIKHLYRRGEQSQYVHVFSPIVHFPDRSLDKIYINSLRRTLQEKVKQCRRQLFVFDDFDKMAYLVGTVVSPILSTSGLVGGADFSQSVFIFIASNMQRIYTSVLLSKYAAGKSRDTLSPGDFDVQQQCNAEEFAECQSSVVTLYSHNVPFLPLEREHVACCVRAAAKALKCSIGNPGASADGDLVRLTNQVEFVGHGTSADKVELAEAGCKKLGAQLAKLCP